MKVKVYVKWRYEEIINEKEFKEKIAQTVNNYKTEETYFNEWLNNNYNAFNIWGMSAEERAKILEEFADICQTWAEEEVADDWEEIEIEI